MSHSLRRNLSLCAGISMLMAGLACVVVDGPIRSSAHGMPPSPRVLEMIRDGKASLPEFMTDPAVAARLSAPQNIPEGAPGLPVLQARRSGGVGAGSLRTLAVVVDFSDKVSTVTASYFDTLIFEAPKAGRGSVRDYFNEISYGTVDIVTVNFPSVLGWTRAPQTYAYYVNHNNGTGVYPNNAQRLAEDIVDAISGVVDFSQYDNNLDGVMEPIMLIHAGPGAEFTNNLDDIWSHSAALHTAKSYDGVLISDYVIMPEYYVTVSAETSDMTIGVFAHEMGHGFWDLPDLYDRNSTSSGVGDWSLMAGGSWNGPATLCPSSCYTDGSSPAWPDAWSRVQMGFATAAPITANSTGFSFPHVEGNAPPTDTVFLLDSIRQGRLEYYLLENRQQTLGTYDEYLPGAGLFIWHVDEMMNTYFKQNDYECRVLDLTGCDISLHPLVALQQADADLDLEWAANQGDTGDPYPGSQTNRTWTFTTSPGSRSWYNAAPSCLAVRNISDSGAAMTADISLDCPESVFTFLPNAMSGAPFTIGNGNFEGGPLYYWIESNPLGLDMVDTWGDLPYAFPDARSGRYYAMLGGGTNLVNYIEQTVTVPAARPYLGFYQWVMSNEEYCEFDKASVWADGTQVTEYGLCGFSTGWTKKVVDLRAYVGTTITLRIRVSNDSLMYTVLFVDDVAFQSGAT